MQPMTQNGMLILIIGSACCVLLGIIIAIVRAVKFVRRERMMEAKILSSLRTEEAIREASDRAASEKNENSPLN